MTIQSSDSNSGSYAFGQFEEKQDELERLKSQAGAARELERNILTGCGLRSGMVVLDLACGPGVVSCELADMAKPGTVTGIDFSADLLAEAEQLANSRGLDNLSFRQGDVYALDLPDDSFDFIYARFLFQHLEHTEKVLQEALRVLKPGGIMAIADVDDGWLTLYPEPEGFSSFAQRAARAQASRGGDRFIGRKLGGLLQNSGFDSVRVSVQTVTTADLGLKGFLDITTGFKYRQLTGEDKEIGARERAGIYESMHQTRAWGFTGIFIAVGRKRDD